MPIGNAGRIYCGFHAIKICGSILGAAFMLKIGCGFDAELPPDAGLPRNLPNCRPTHKTAEEYVGL